MKPRSFTVYQECAAIIGAAAFGVIFLDPYGILLGFVVLIVLALLRRP